MHFTKDGIELKYTEIAIVSLSFLSILIVYLIFQIDSTTYSLNLFEKIQQRFKNQFKKPTENKAESIENKNNSTNKENIMNDTKHTDPNQTKSAAKHVQSQSGEQEPAQEQACPFHQIKQIVESKTKTNNKNNDVERSHNNSNTGGGCAFNPSKIISDGKKKQKKSIFKIPNVSPLGTISLEELNKYHCDSDRQCLSILGTIYDVTHAKYKYGPEGSYKSFAGHDVTLALGSGKLEEKWLDKFVEYPSKYVESVKNWMELYDQQYAKCGKLDLFENKGDSKWPTLSSEDREELDKECTLM